MKLDIDTQIKKEKKLSSVYAGKEPAAANFCFAPYYNNMLFSYKETYLDFEKMEIESRNLIDIMIRSESDMPAVVHTFCTVGMVAEAFGCEISLPEEGFPWTQRAIGNINDVYKLKPKKVSELSYYGRMRQWVDYSQRKMGTDLPFWGLDIQSPFSVADQIVGTEELFVACIENPKAVHHLLEMITEVTIALHDDHIAQAEHPGFPGRNYPCVSQNIGLCYSDDTPLIMLSSGMYQEFALPYANALSRHFNGLHIHSCGGYMHNMDNALAIENVRSVQLHAGPGEYVLPETQGEECGFVHAARKIPIFIDTNAISRSERWSDKPFEFYEEYLIPRLKLNRPDWLLLEVAAPTGDPDQYSEYTRRTNQYLKTLGF